jgi:hypothetical protein
VTALRIYTATDAVSLLMFVQQMWLDIKEMPIYQSTILDGFNKKYHMQQVYNTWKMVKFKHLKELVRDYAHKQKRWRDYLAAGTRLDL